MKTDAKKWFLLLVAGATAIVLIALLVLQPWSASPGPEEALAAAQEELIGLRSFRMEASGTVTQEGETTEGGYELEYSAPDRYHIGSESDGEADEFIIIGDQVFSREPDRIGSRTAEAMTMGLAGSVLSKELTLTYLESLVDVAELPDETVDGTDCLHYQGRIDLTSGLDDAIAELDPNDSRYEGMRQVLESQKEWLSRQRSEVELWIGKDDYLLRRLRYLMQIPAWDPLEEDSETAEQEEWDSVSMVVRYYDFNEDISIEPPLSDSGELLPGWYQVGDA
jgi:outer membrane lipoprotein-sorting protein